MKTILLPVSPIEGMNTLNGKQTIIIRKSVPKDELPIKVCLYCSDSKDFLLDKDQNYFVWDKHEHHYFYRYEEEPKEHYFQKKVIAEFMLMEVEKIIALTGEHPTEYYAEGMDLDSVLCKATLFKEELRNYLKTKDGYAYHISNLIILDVPKKPSEFKYRKKYHGCKRCPYGKEYNPASDFSVCYTCSELLKVSRVHGPYMYVEEDE